MKLNKTSAKYCTSPSSSHFEWTIYNSGHFFGIFQDYSDKLSW